MVTAPWVPWIEESPSRCASPERLCAFFLSSASLNLRFISSEALDKKNAQSREGEAHLDGDSSIHGTHGAVTKREFRRKSG